MSDDHASHALSAYGSRINRTPHLDRIADGGIRFDAAFCTNSICTPSRAAVLTGTYNHVNGVTTLDTPMDNRLPTFVTALRSAGFQTAVFGKWHLGHGAGHDPAGFDEWRVLPDQGEYHDPLLLGPKGPEQHRGYVTDIITDMCLDWLERRDPDRPFACSATTRRPIAPGSPTSPRPPLRRRRHPAARDALGRSRHPVPGRPSGRTAPAAPRPRARPEGEMPEGLSLEQEIVWGTSATSRTTCACVAAMDDNVGRVLDYSRREAWPRHHRHLHLRPGLLPRRPRLVRQALHVRGVALRMPLRPLPA
jgi:arylsulfatase A-like enzyme